MGQLPTYTENRGFCFVFLFYYSGYFSKMMPICEMTFTEWRACLKGSLKSLLGAHQEAGKWVAAQHWLRAERSSSVAESNYLSLSMVAIESRSLDLWSLPIATLWLCHQEEILIFSRLQIESVSVNPVPASSLIPSLLLLSLSSSPQQFNSHNTVHS